MKYVTILLIVLLSIAACTVPYGKQAQTQSQSNESLPSDKPTAAGIEKFNLTSTSVDGCALLTIEEGNSLCGTNVQMSGMQPDAEGVPFNCVQTFIQNHLPYDRAIINVMDYKTPAEANSKYTWDLKVLRGKETKPGAFFATESAKDIIEFKDGQYVARIFDMPSGACKNIDKVTELAM